MEILFITHKFPPSIGGMQKQSYELINGVAKSYKVHSLIYDNRSSKFKFFLTATFKAKKILKENPGISLIHFNDGLMALLTYPLIKTTNLPTLVTIHGSEIVIPSNLLVRASRKLSEHLDGIIAVSQATAEGCVRRGMDKSKVYIVRNGVDTELSQINKDAGFRKILEKKLGIPLENKKILVSVGRSVRRKGFSWFMTKVLPNLNKDIIYLIIGPPQRHIRKINFILNLLPKSFSNLISILLGIGLDEIDIQEALRKPDIKDRAYYLGKLPFEEMVQVLKHADLYIMPNIKVMGDAEGFGLVALEASINGLPVLASALEGITCAVIDGMNGFLVPPENADAWIEKIESVLSDSNALKKFGENGQKYTIENYAWDKMIEGYISVFKKYHFQHQYHNSINLAKENESYSELSESTRLRHCRENS